MDIGPVDGPQIKKHRKALINSQNDPIKIYGKHHRSSKYTVSVPLS